MHTYLDFYRIALLLTMGCKESKPQNDRSSIRKDRVDNNNEKPAPTYKKNEVKISFLGNQSVGKTCYYLQTKGDFENFKNVTTMPSGDNAVKHVEIDGYGKVLAVLWDTAGQETYFAVTATIIKKSHAVMLLYAIDNRDSFDR